MARKVARSAITGRFVKPSTAKRSPDHRHRDGEVEGKAEALEVAGWVSRPPRLFSAYERT